MLHMVAENVDCSPPGDPFLGVVMLFLYTFLQIAVQCCDGRRSFSHQEALRTTSEIFTTIYDVGSGFIETLVCLALWLDSRSHFWP